MIQPRNLPAGAKTEILADGVPTTVTFKKMDGMYAQWFDDKGEMYVFNAQFEDKGDGFYEIIGK